MLDINENYYRLGCTLPPRMSVGEGSREGPCVVLFSYIFSVKGNSSSLPRLRPYRGTISTTPLHNTRNEIENDYGIKEV